MLHTSDSERGACSHLVCQMERHILSSSTPEKHGQHTKIKRSAPLRWHLVCIAVLFACKEGQHRTHHVTVLEAVTFDADMALIYYCSSKELLSLKD